MKQKIKSSENPIIKGKLKGRNEKGQFVKGEYEGGPGKPVGTKSFSTLMDEAVKEIAKMNKISVGEVWQVLIKRGYSEAKDGNYMFYKDLLDRYYGKAQDSVDITSGGKPIPLFDYVKKCE